MRDKGSDEVSPKGGPSVPSLRTPLEEGPDVCNFTWFSGFESRKGSRGHRGEERDLRQDLYTLVLLHRRRNGKDNKTGYTIKPLRRDPFGPKFR